MRRHGAQSDDLITAQRFEERLEAAADEAAQARPVDLNLGDPRRPRDLSRRRRPDECRLNSLAR